MVLEAMLFPVRVRAGAPYFIIAEIKNKIMNRKIRIWCKTQDANSIFKIETFNFVEIYTSKKNHWYIEIPIDQTNNNLKISCLHGSLQIGKIEINYSWEINSYYYENYLHETRLLEQNEFDLSLCSKKMLDDLLTIPLWVDTGENNFSAVENLVLNPTVNLKSVQLTDWILLTSNDIFACKVYCPRLPESWIKTRPVLDIRQFNSIETIQYNKEIISKVDNRFNSLVKKILLDPLSNKSTVEHDKKDLPYAWKTRIQAQLVDNMELIADKHVIDIGADLGQFTYPCTILGCKTVTSAQIVDEHNQAIQSAANHYGLQDQIKIVKCDIYDTENVNRSLHGIDTILFLGVIYHINHHYQLLETFTNSNATGIVIDCIIEDLSFWNDPQPKMNWIMEYQNKEGNGIEYKSPNSKVTWVGIPNASWIVNSLEILGWEILRMSQTKSLTLSKMRHRGIISAKRKPK